MGKKLLNSYPKMKGMTIAMYSTPRGYTSFARYGMAVRLFKGTASKMVKKSFDHLKTSRWKTVGAIVSGEFKTRVSVNRRAVLHRMRNFVWILVSDIKDRENKIKEKKAKEVKAKAKIERRKKADERRIK